MPWFRPAAPPYDPEQWRAQPLEQRALQAATGWVEQGYGAPLAVYSFYLAKIVLYVGGWLLACRFTPGLGELSTLDAWWAHPVAFQKAIVWSLAFEVMGLGCGSGPLTGRYWPPFAGVLHFLRPGTIKLPLAERSRLLGGSRRGLVDVLGFAALLYALGRCLVAVAPGHYEFWPIVGLLALLGLRDRTIFLAARAEHYWVTVAIFAFAPSTAAWMAGAKVVQLALWFWAGVSKLNAHFPSVVAVMVSNGPLTPFRWLRRRMYRDYPRDLRPSALARAAAHGGAALEFGVPLVFGLSAMGVGGETLVWLGLGLMLALHLYITANVPMGVPIEWNVMVVYGGAVLFVAHAPITLDALAPWPLVLFVLANAVAVPLWGNLQPARVSFLPSMRYYAGNWAYSVWLFRDESYRKLDRLTKSSPWLHDQLGRFYDATTVLGITSKVLAFRIMHLHGRALQSLVPRAVDDPEPYEWVDGELVAGIALGWNFGDGHLHDERLLRALQVRCGFAPGELRCIFVESQPLHRRRLAWRIADAATGPIDAGEIEVDELLRRQPWGPAMAMAARAEPEAKDPAAGA